MNRRLAPFFLASCVFGADPEWPGFRGPVSNPSSVSSNLPEKWSKTANIEWSATLPGLGWSSPIVAGKSVFVTTVTSDGKAKQPQIGSNYSNDYIAELQKQGLSSGSILQAISQNSDSCSESPLGASFWCEGLLPPGTK